MPVVDPPSHPVRYGDCSSVLAHCTCLAATAKIEDRLVIHKHFLILHAFSTDQASHSQGRLWQGRVDEAHRSNSTFGVKRVRACAGGRQAQRLLQSSGPAHQHRPKTSRGEKPHCDPHLQTAWFARPSSIKRLHDALDCRPSVDVYIDYS